MIRKQLLHSKNIHTCKNSSRLKSLVFGIVLMVSAGFYPVFAVDPDAISDLTLWLDADDVNGDGSAAAAEVLEWTDKSGANNHVTGVAGQGPAPVSNALNGKTVLDFDNASNDSLVTATAAPITANTGYTKFVVFKLNTTVGGNNLISSSGSVALWTNGSTELKMYHDGNFVDSTSVSVNTSDYFVAAARYGNNITASIININGTEDGSETATHNFTANPIEIGSFAGDNFLDGQIAEALVYDRALTDQEIEDVECYLSTKWAIAVSNACNGAANESPTDISLSPSSVVSGTPIGAQVGILSTTDADSGDTHTYSLVSGVGDEDNGKFMLNAGNNNSLDLNFVPDADNPTDLGDTAGNNTYSIRVQSTDGVSTPFSKAVIVTVTGNNAPTDIKLDGGDADSVAGSTASGTNISVLSTIDADAGDTFTYAFVAGVGGEDNAKFSIVRSNLALAFTPDFANPTDLGAGAANNTYTINIKTTDAANHSFTRSFIITVVAPDSGPFCSTAPSAAGNNVAVTTTCTGVPNGGELTIANMNCGDEANNTVQCVGIVGTQAGNVSTSNDVVSIGGVNTGETTGLTVDLTPPAAASCVFSPSVAIVDVEVTASCTGIEPGGSVSIPEMNCTSLSLPCVGRAPAIGTNPSIITSDSAGNKTTTTGEFTFDNTPPDAAVCTFTPTTTNDPATAVEAICSGIEDGGLVAIGTLTCSATAGGYSCVGPAENVGTEIITTDALGNSVNATITGFVLGDSEPLAANCSFTPDTGSGATVVTATCTGVESGGSVSITGLSCGAVTNGVVTCTGTAQSLGDNPVIITTGAAGGTVETSATGGFTVVATGGGGGGSMKWPFLVLLMTGFWIRLRHKTHRN